MGTNARSQIFKPYALLIAAATLVVMLFLFSVVATSNYNKAVYQQQEVLYSDAAKLGAVLDHVGLIASQVNSSSELLNIFVQLDGDPSEANYFDENLLDSIRAGSILETINSLTSSVSRICVFNASGDLLSAGQMYVEDAATRETLAGALAQRLTAALETQSALVVGPHADWWSASGAQLVSYVIPLSSVYNEKNYGIVEVEFRLDDLKKLDFMNRDDGARYLLADGSGADALGSGTDLSELAYLTDADGARQDVWHLRRRLNGAQTEVLATRIERTDWTLMRAVPLRALIQPYIGGYVSILMGFIVLILILLLIAYNMAARVSRPLNEFAQAISGVTLGNMRMPQFSSNFKRSHEMDMLEESFRHMLNKLDSSVGLEMKAYLNALQSQMDPHFLYNMLTVIAEIADSDVESSNNRHIVAICQRLSKMLRYMASYESNLVSLRYELEHLGIYLELMHDRYEDGFSYEIKTIDSMLDIRVPKMILQPLAENCFRHGFKKVRPPWRIEAEMHAEGDCWCFSVSDNGGGISEAEIRGIYQKIDEFSGDVAANYEQMRIGGLGLVNTVLRMKLSQGAQPIFRIENRADCGTRITIGGAR